MKNIINIEITISIIFLLNLLFVQNLYCQDSNKIPSVQQKVELEKTLSEQFKEMKNEIIKKIDEKDNWFEKLLPSLIALITAIIVVLITAGFTFRHRYIEFEKELRLKWINNFREKISELLMLIDSLYVQRRNITEYISKDPEVDTKKYYDDFMKDNKILERLMYEIVLFLDDDNDKHKDLYNLLDIYIKQAVNYTYSPRDINDFLKKLDESLDKLSDRCINLAKILIKEENINIKKLNLFSHF